MHLPKNPPVERRQECHKIKKKSPELNLNLVKHDVDIFAIMDAKLTAEKLIYYQVKGYTFYSLPKYRQIASYNLIGVRKSLCAEFKIYPRTINLTNMKFTMKDQTLLNYGLKHSIGNLSKHTG
jgi:hypothetical protein